MKFAWVMIEGRSVEAQSQSSGMLAGGRDCLVSHLCKCRLIEGLTPLWGNAVSAD